MTALMSSGLVAWRWDVVFYAYGVVGIIWSITFYLACPVSPKETELSMCKRDKKPSYAMVEENSPSETDTDTLSEIDGHPVDKAAKCSQVFLASKALFLNKGFLAVMCAHVAHNYGYYVVLMWLPKYFLSLHIDLQDVGSFAVLPYLCMFAFDVLWGRFVDFLLTRHATQTHHHHHHTHAIVFVCE